MELLSKIQLRTHTLLSRHCLKFSYETLDFNDAEFVWDYLGDRF